MITANSKMRRLAVFYCIVLLVLLPRAAYTGFLAYASAGFTRTLDCDQCDTCQTINYIIYSWTQYHQEIPAIISAFSSALLTVVSLFFILTQQEKQLLRTGRAAEEASGFDANVEMMLHQQLGLNQSLL